MKYVSVNSVSNYTLKKKALLPKTRLTICLVIGHRLSLFGETLSTVAWPPSCQSHGDLFVRISYRPINIIITQVINESSAQSKAAQHEAMWLWANLPRKANANVEVLWHINVDFLEDRLHIGVSVLRKLGQRTAAGLSKSHKAGLFVLTSKFLAECNNTENGQSSLNLNASCESNRDQILARTVAAQCVRRSPGAQWALTARREWRTWTQHELGTRCSVPEASSLLLTSSF